MVFIGEGITVFIDIEWSQPTDIFELEKCQMLQIACASIQEDGSDFRTYARTIRPTDPENVSEACLKRMDTQMHNLINASTKDVVLKNLCTTYKDARVIVVWNKSTYDLLMYDLDKLGYKLRKHKLVVVRDLIKSISQFSRATFEFALDVLKVEHNKALLHHAKYDVAYLKCACEKLKYLYAKTMGNKGCTFYKNSNTGTIHSADCSYLSRANNYEALDDASFLLSGSLCSCCNKKRAYRILKLKIPKNTDEAYDYVDRSYEYTESNIQALNEKYDINIRFGFEGTLYVDTGRTKWRIYYDKEGVQEVYHENYKGRSYKYGGKSVRGKIEKNTKIGKEKEGFHLQGNIKTKRLEGVIKYIKNHDVGFTVKYKKTRVEMLLEQLEQEKKSGS